VKTEKRRLRSSTIIRLAILTFLVVGMAAAAALPPVREFIRPRLLHFLEEIRGLGAWGPVILAGAYVVASVVAFPGILLSVAAGFLFGVTYGTAAASIGSTLGAAAAFGVGRFLARGVVQAKVARDPKFRAIDQAVAAQGFKIVLLIRLAPVFPFNLMNYAFGLT
jgi:uncharacterized membrane protein YdjX (TVP38/TMEM64 family)